ncbi:MAG: hypothetical protein WEB88_05925, partial [Gemmatimonadota bacterium]
MSLLPCKRCGRTDPRKMIGLMNLWFGRFLELPLEGGYFYLCPACYKELVVPHLADVRQQVLEVHPHLRRHLERERQADERERQADERE